MAIYNGHNEDSSGNILLSIGNGMTATVETGSTASQAYTKGAYLFFNNRLCKATTAISSGATLAVGTNLSNTSVGQELTSHLRSSDGKEFYFDVKNGTYGYYPSASKVSSEFVPFGGTAPHIYYAYAYNAYAQSWQIVTYQVFTKDQLSGFTTMNATHTVVYPNDTIAFGADTPSVSGSYSYGTNLTIPSFSSLLYVRFLSALPYGGADNITITFS